MNTERWLQFHTVALAIMGTWFLGWGQESVALPAALTVAALASLLPLRFSRFLRMNRLVANIGALAAVAWSLRDFLARGSEAQLLAIADMLIYLQIVLLFQEKSNRVYWQLLVLSVLQVVVAAALNLGPQFALLLGVYMAVAISTLVLLCFHSESKQTQRAGPKPSTAPAWQQLLAPPEVAAVPTYEANPTPSRRLVFRQVGLLTGATFLFTTVFFYATPRLGDGAWVGSRAGGLATTGFSPDLVLEDSGTIQQSNQLVMRVHFSKFIDRRPYPLIDEPYFNGVILTEYKTSPEGSRWVAPLATRRRRAPRGSLHVNQPSSALALVRQEIALENANSPILFAVMPIHPIADTPDDLKHLRVSSRLVRVIDDEYAGQREYRYALGTMAFRDGRQLRATPHVSALRDHWDQVLLSDDLAELTEFNAEQHPVVAQLAEQILEEQGLLDAPRLDQILALQAHFKTPGLYKYSLNLNFVRHRDLDPLEDFLANHRIGHCEYYASALAMMLRSRGIPSRIVNGYRGGEYNSLGNYYQVRQKHAHAWVEAYLSAEDTPKEEVAGLPSSGGSWFRLDPTPAAQGAAGPPGDPSFTDQVGDAFDYVDLLWRDYVLGLNSSRQKDTFYDPLTNRTAGSLPAWMEVSRVQSVVQKWRGHRGRDVSERSSRSPLGLAVSGGIVLLILAAVGRAVYAFVRGGAFPKWLKGSKAVSADRARVEFYHRLEKLLSRLRLRRLPGQTPLEFARQAADALRTIIRETPLAGDMADLPSLPTRIVAAYYQVRFGGVRLDPEEAALIEQSLAQLVHATSKRQKN